MTIKEPQPQGDEFDAFLNREDDLSALLQSLPQPDPSQHLDAVVLADARRAVERSKKGRPSAANDAVMPLSARIKRLNFVSRWGISTGLAVSAAVTFMLFLLLPIAPHKERPSAAKSVRPLEVRILKDSTNTSSPPQSIAESPLSPRAVPELPVIPPPAIVDHTLPNSNVKPTLKDQRQATAR